jgi:hypothetical protein
MRKAGKSNKAKAGAKSRSSGDSRDFAAGVGRALRLAAKEARRVARLHGTPIYIWEDGKVKAIKP